jgi:hypothetical protein
MTATAVIRGRGRWLAALAAGLVVAGAASACGPGTGTQVRTSGQAVPAAVLAAAATSTGVQHTAQLTVTASLSAAMLAQPITVHGSGAVNLDTKAAELDLTMSGPMPGSSASSGAGHLMELVAGGQLYVSGGPLTSVLPAGKTWIQVGDLSNLSGATSVASLPQASSALTLLQNLGGDVTEVGTESIGGVPTTHYRADIDLAKVAAKLPAGLPADLEAMLTQVGHDGHIPADVWVGSDGLVHQVALQVTVGSVMGQALDLSATVTETLDHFGEPVDISAPPADQVAPFSGLAGLGH